MLLGSVPSPPKKPKSWMSTQTARQNTPAAMTAARATRLRLVSSPAPMTASAITANRFTAKPCATSKDAERGDDPLQEVRLG